MGRFIAKLEERYFEYSTIVDAPITDPMTAAEFQAYYRDKYGSSGLEDLPLRLERVEKTGCSARDGMSVEDMIVCNRAGDNESQWTLDQFKAWARGEK